MNEKRRRIAGIAGIVLFALLLLPFFLGAPAAHPATDDFTFATYTHRTWQETHSLPYVLKDAASYTLRTWRDWQGTATGVFLMALNPAVFDWRGYGWHVPLLLALDIAAALVFCMHFLRRFGVGKRLRWALALALCCCQLLFLPDIVEGVYWFNGAWFYMGAQAVALLTLAGADTLCARRTQGVSDILKGLVLAVALFALGMDNYITAMMTLAALFMLAAQRLYAGVSKRDAEEKRAALRLACCLVPIGAGLLLSVIAPGNAVRMATDGAYEGGPLWLASSLLWTARDALKYIARFALKTPLLAILLLLTPLLARTLPENDPKDGVPPVWATLLGFYAVLCAMIVPHMYSSGYAGSGRVVNMYHSYVLLALPLAWCLVLRRLKANARALLCGRKAQRGFLAASVVALMICLLGGQLGNYGKLISDQLNGNQAAYIRQFQNEYALCEAAQPGEDVLLPAWQVQTVTGKPTAYPDPTVWTNVSMADYFGVGSVRAEEEQAAR